MQIWVNIHTYNTYGGHQTLSLIGRYFASGHPDVGASIREIEVHVYFRNAGAPKATLESLFDRYDNFIKQLPTSRFHRKKSKFEISYLSALGDSQLVADFAPPKLDLFVTGSHEVAQQLTAIQGKLKRSDDFDSEKFSRWIQQRLADLPGNDDDLAALKIRLDAEWKQARAAMDDWGKLGIEWEDFHPNARAILDLPFFWDCADDFAPHGNDTGADVLDLYATWRKRAKNSPGLGFLANLMQDWGFTTPHPSDDESMNTVWEEAKIGLAFAQLKIDGNCEASVRDAALESIALFRSRTTAGHRNWEHFEERIRTLDVLENKLKEWATRCA